MAIVEIEPDDTHPVPYDLSPEKGKTFKDELVIAANTADLLADLTPTPEVGPEETEKTRRLLEQALKNHNTRALSKPAVALKASQFIKEYGQNLAFDLAATRAAMTNKLLELANCGDPRYELKALELLGKHSDIGLFTERSEVTINYKDPADLENAIKERVKRLLHAQVIDAVPLHTTLDDELGTFGTEEEPQKDQETSSEPLVPGVPDAEDQK